MSVHSDRSEQASSFPLTQANTLGSILIPAHNEAMVIERCLESLFAGFEKNEIEVVVVCNGCTDDTADVIRNSDYLVRVIEIQEASKSAALRAGDAALTTFPRIYLDADITIAGSAVRQVLGTLAAGPYIAARPPLEYDTTACTALVRTYFRARQRVPELMGALWGAGAYGLSAVGRARFSSFPNFMADDVFVDQCFSRSEIKIVDSVPLIVQPPRRLRDLIRIMRRGYRGTAEVRAHANKGTTTNGTIRGLVKAARTGPGAAIDCTVYIAIALIARLTVKMSPPRGWARDNSTRTIE